MLVFITLGLFIWSLFSPQIAAYIFIALFSLIEGWFLFLDLIKRPNVLYYMDKYDLTIVEGGLFKKYYVFFRAPSFSSKISGSISGFQYSVILWVP